MLTKNSVVLFNQTFEVIWYRHQIDLIKIELEQTKLLVSWQKPPQGKYIGEDQDLPKQIRFASEERSQLVEATIKEILQVREFDESTLNL